MKVLSILVLVVAVASVYGADLDNEIEPKPRANNGMASIEERQRLITDLFTSYDKRNHPLNHTVKFGLALLKLDIDEDKAVLDTDVWFRYVWDDPRLKWNEEDYGGQKVIRIPSAEVWKPDITLYNHAHPVEGVQCVETNALIYSSGQVLWVPPCHLRSNCDINREEPFGPQTCQLKFGSWTFDEYSMDVQFYNNEADIDVTDFKDISTWALTAHSGKREEKTYDCCVEPYVSLTFDLTIQKKASQGRCSA